MIGKKEEKKMNAPLRPLGSQTKVLSSMHVTTKSWLNAVASSQDLGSFSGKAPQASPLTKKKKKNFPCTSALNALLFYLFYTPITVF